MEVSNSRLSWTLLPVLVNSYFIYHHLYMNLLNWMFWFPGCLKLIWVSHVSKLSMKFPLWLEQFKINKCSHTHTCQTSTLFHTFDWPHCNCRNYIKGRMVSTNMPTPNRASLTGPSYKGANWLLQRISSRLQKCSHMTGDETWKLIKIM